MTAPSIPVRDAGGRTDREPPDGSPVRKATLHCPDCGFGGPVDAWDVNTTRTRRRTRCPECRSVVDDRRVGDPRPTAVDASAAGPGSTPIRWCLDAWDRYWSTWTALVAGRSVDDY